MIPTIQQGGMMTIETAIAITLDDLVTSLGRFPQDVLPEGVIREIIARGPSANEVLLSRLVAAAENADGGIGSIPSESFFCFAMLGTRPDVNMLPTIARLCKLDEDAFDRIIGELKHDFNTALIVKMTDETNVGMIHQWIDSMIHDPQVGLYAKWSLVGVLPYWVRDGLMRRESAIDQLTNWVRQRSGETNDTLSGACVCELLDLNACEEKSFIESCFDLGQIDESLVDRESCLNELSERRTKAKELNRSNGAEGDLIEYFRGWYGYSMASDSLDPRCTDYRDIGSKHWLDRDETIEDTDVDRWFDEVRQSNDQNYPREAVESLSLHASQVVDRLVDEVRWGLQQAGGPNARTSNGPFIAATILASDNHSSATDVFLGILDLSPDHRANVFGDAIEPSIVAALSASLLGDCDPIDQRIDDDSRDDLDRAMLVMFYPLSVWHGYLGRQKCIDRLTDRLERQLDGPSALSGAIYDALCLMSVSKAEPIVCRALENGIQNHFISESTARDCIEKPSRAGKTVWNIISEFRSPQEMIENSVMFDRDVINPPRVAPSPLIASPMSMSEGYSTTVVNDTTTHIPRNSPCTCGSGRKYKKCCGKR
jgi:hypothetical protein